jgi:hypothetical protein
MSHLLFQPLAPHLSLQFVIDIMILIKYVIFLCPYVGNGLLVFNALSFWQGAKKFLFSLLICYYYQPATTVYPSLSFVGLEPMLLTAKALHWILTAGPKPQISILFSFSKR